MRTILSFVFLVVGCALATACNDTTGGARFSFSAAAAGPAEATGGPLSYTNSLGYHLVLTRAHLHVGAIYLNRSAPLPGSQETGCILPGIYVAQVRGGVDVDALSPVKQPFPVAGEAIAETAVAGEVWLAGGAIDAPEDDTVIADVAGTFDLGGATHPFAATITIGSNWLPRTKDPAAPGAHPICKQRIVSPVAVDAALTPGGALLLRIDPRIWFRTVDFSTVSPSKDPADPPGTYRFQNSFVGPAETDLFASLHARADAYTFSWQSDRKE